MTTLHWIYHWWSAPRKEFTMSRLEVLQTRLLADGAIDEAEVDLLRRELYADGQIDREEVEFLASLRLKATRVCPAFEQLLFTALKEFLLADGTIDADETALLRQLLFADGTIDALELQFLTELHTQARKVCPEFQQLLDECVRR
jgi:hypothetical protein